MNAAELKKSIDWQKTGMTKGIKIKQIPRTGNAVYYGVGSDSYGYQIGEVAPDGTWFEMLDEHGRFEGIAILVTRKNSPLCGYYCRSNDGTKHGKPSYYRSRGCICGSLSVTQEHGCGKTYLDPSF